MSLPTMADHTSEGLYGAIWMFLTTPALLRCAARMRSTIPYGRAPIVI
jgi:hypothetical protein